MVKKVKHPKIHRCSLCGKRYAYLNSTLHVSQSYRMHFCNGCTVIVQEMIRKLRKTLDARS